MSDELSRYKLAELLVSTVVETVSTGWCHSNWIRPGYSSSQETHSCQLELSLDSSSYELPGKSVYVLTEIVVDDAATELSVSDAVNCLL